MELLVKNNFLITKNEKYKCAIGAKGLTKNKIEGDLCTPIGIFNFNKIYYRHDRLGKLDFLIESSILRENDGWCDDQKSKFYNQSIRFPFCDSAEHLYKDDHVYDIICVLNYNTDPIVPGKGSAIFLHIAQNNFEGTEGCIAVEKEALIKIACNITKESKIEIKP